MLLEASTETLLIFFPVRDALFLADADMVQRAVDIYRTSFASLPVNAFVALLESTTLPETVGVQADCAAVTVNVQVSVPIKVEPEYVLQVRVTVPVFALGICA